MNTDLLRGIPGIEVAPPADDVDLAVAEALLPVALPPSALEFMAASNGARLGQVEIFDLERITTVTPAREHSWQLPGTLIVGTAGPGRALEAGRARLLRDTDSLLEVGIGSNWGQPLAAGLEEFQRVEDDRVPEMLGAEEFEDMLLNYRPDPSGPSLSAQVQWAVACNDIVLADVRDRIRLAPLSDAVTGRGRWVVDGEFTVADCVRSNAFLALVAQARDDMFTHATGRESTSAILSTSSATGSAEVVIGLALH